MHRLLWIILLVVGFMLGVPAYAQYADVRATFLASNPNNGWEYGFLDENGDFIAYNTTFDDGQGIAGWCLDNTPGPRGDITINYSDYPIERYGVIWEPGQVCVHTEQEAYTTVVRWIAPETNCYVISAGLTDQSGNTSASVEIVNGENTLAEGNVGADQSGTEICGSSILSLLSDGSSDDEISAFVAVSKGDVIDTVFHTGGSSGHIGVALRVDNWDIFSSGIGKHSPKNAKRYVDLPDFMKSSFFRSVRI